MESIGDLIERAGGAAAIAKRSQDTAHPVTEWAVWKWQERGRIPQDQWALVMAMTEASIDVIYRIHNPVGAVAIAS